MIVVLPMAGRGSRFSTKGYDIPKPLISVKGKPMFAWALESLDDIEYSQIIVIALKEYEKQFGIVQMVKQYAGKNAMIVLLDDVTQGQLCTVLAAKDYINKEEDLLITSSDTIVVSEIGNEIKNKNKNYQGIISVSDMPGDQWSFAQADENGKVTRVTEKVRISEHASTGMYYFSNGRNFIYTAEQMILNKEMTKGEYYVIPVYQKYIQQGMEISISKAKEMWDMGTPDSLELFIRQKLDSRAA